MIPQHIPLINRKDLKLKINEYLDTEGHFTEYLKTEEFENKLADFLKVKYCFAMNNGTISLSIALLALGVVPGDTVLVPNITMIATSSAVKLIGAIPIFVDVTSSNLCMDLLKLKQAIVEYSPKVVIYVSLNGRSHTSEELTECYSFCNSLGIGILEDNAQSLGSKKTNGQFISAPDSGIGSFSFSSPKIITTGQGGALVTDDDYLAKKIKKLKDFGRITGGTDIHDEFGINSKFTELQAIMGLSQFETIDLRIQIKKTIYQKYKTLLEKVKQISWLDTNCEIVCPWFVDIYVSEREELISYLLTKQIQTRKIYPALNTQKVNANHTQKKDNFRNSLNLAELGLWLPSSLGITLDQINLICESIKEFYARK